MWRKVLQRLGGWGQLALPTGATTMSDPINEQVWHQMTHKVMTGMRAWCLTHPKATLREMEHALDAG